MFTAFARNGRLIALSIAILIVAGLGALNTLPRTEDPRIVNRTAIVITHMPGASAERVEALVSEKIESKLRKLSTIKHLTSVSKPGISSVRIELKDDVVETAPIWSRTRDLLSDVEASLPPGAGKPELDDDRGYAFTSLIALQWQGSGEPDLATLGRYAKTLQDRLRALPGSDFVELFGEQQEEIRVEIDPHQINHLQLTAQQISQFIAAADAKVSAGELFNTQNQMQIELYGALDSVDRIRQVTLQHDANGFMLRVGDIATVKRAIQQPYRELAIIDGQPAVVVSARMLPDLRVDQWMAQVREEQQRFNATLPAQISSRMLFDQNSYTEKRLSELVSNILIGFGLIAVVLLVTLGWRPAMIVALSLPLTVLFTLAVMKFTGLPIHQMSVTGLVVALGIMVDNAIVMADTIQQRRQQGDTASSAVQHALNHLWLPLLGSTLTTILAFMPIVLMPGPAGEFVGGIALSVIFSLIGSYLISHSIIAGLSGRFIAVNSGKTRWYHNGIQTPRISRAFKGSLKLALSYPLLTVILMAALPITGFVMAKQLTEQFFPASDRDMFTIEVHLPSQSSLQNTRQLSEQISAELSENPDIREAQWFIGNNAPSFYYNMLGGKQGEQNFAQAMVTATDFRAANQMIPQLQMQLDDLFPQAQILVRKLEQGPPFNAPVEFRIYGPNLDKLKLLGQNLRKILSQTDEVIHSRATLLPGTPKVWLKVDESASRITGLSLTDMAAQLQGNLRGNVGGTLLEATESLPVRVRVADEQRQQINDLSSLSLSSQQAQHTIPLSALASLELKPSRGAIPRRDGERVNVIEGYIRAGILPSTVLADIQQQLEAQKFQMPAGYRLEIGGESAKRDNAVGNLLASIGVIATLLITVVVLSFNSFRISGLIFLSAFQSVGLGLLSVWFFNHPFGFTVIIGLLGLMGLAINAAIVILAELKADPQAIEGDQNAVVAAVLSCTRHISSTTITTVGGFLPLIIAGGGFWPPFAIAIAGGTVLTTLLSFYFVPVMFVVMNRRKAFQLTGATAQA